MTILFYFNFERAICALGQEYSRFGKPCPTPHRRRESRESLIFHFFDSLRPSYSSNPPNTMKNIFSTAHGFLWQNSGTNSVFGRALPLIRFCNRHLVQVGLSIVDIFVYGNWVGSRLQMMSGDIFCMMLISGGLGRSCCREAENIMERRVLP